MAEKRQNFGKKTDAQKAKSAKKNSHRNKNSNKYLRNASANKVTEKVKPEKKKRDKSKPADNINSQYNIQWFPGHMAKTRRLIDANLRLVDAIVEIIDARIPFSSKNPEMDGMTGSKPKIIILNKADSADESVTAKWLNYYKNKGILAIATDCRTGKGVNKFMTALRELLSVQIESWERKGMVGRPIRIMIVGIPNVGKSSFINKLAKSKRAKVEDRPGVTRGKQWVTLDKDLELLDMPGVLWPKFEDKTVGEHLAFTGAVKDDIMDLEYLAVRLLEYLNIDYKKNIFDRYGVETQENESGVSILEKIGSKRGFLIAGGEINTERTAIIFIDEFRAGKLGRITLEQPDFDPTKEKGKS